MKLKKNQTTIYKSFIRHMCGIGMVCTICGKAACNHPTDTLVIYNVDRRKKQIYTPLFCTV